VYAIALRKKGKKQRITQAQTGGQELKEKEKLEEVKKTMAK
jgi:hypothetical protein